jgi:glycosyltransferase involved in cell wall biosynthesis
VLFVTANFNAGGAQRSLFNLALALKGDLDFEIAVCGDSSTTCFSAALAREDVRVCRSAASRDCFDHAEGIVRHLVARRFGTVVFWNVDAKVKLLLAKSLAADVKLIDVSPGAYSFEEMTATSAFQQSIAFDESEYYARLDAHVLKYRGKTPASGSSAIAVIPNGVPAPPERSPRRSGDGAPRIVVSGRIAPSKFLIEIVEAMRVLWHAHSRAELHVLGAAEQRHSAYANALMDSIGDEIGSRVFMHGAAFDAPERLGGFTVALVLGENQGSPNAVLEALAAGVPVIANDSGGTRELVRHGRTGLLLARRTPHEIAAALARIIDDVSLAQRLAQAGRRHVRRRFSMQRMKAGYLKLLTSL